MIVMVRFSSRMVIAVSPPPAVCLVGIAENASQDIGVSVMACCPKKISPCIAQGAAKIFRFSDAATVDYSGALEITFDVWAVNINGANVFSKSLTGGGITLIDTNTFQLDVTNDESLLLPIGWSHCEAWVTLSNGDRRLVGIGNLEVTDTRMHDA